MADNRLRMPNFSDAFYSPISGKFSYSFKENGCGLLSISGVHFLSNIYLPLEGEILHIDWNSVSHNRFLPCCKWKSVMLKVKFLNQFESTVSLRFLCGKLLVRSGDRGVSGAKVGSILGPIDVSISLPKMNFTVLVGSEERISCNQRILSIGN